LLSSTASARVGFVQGGLSASASSAANRNQCSSDTKVSVNTLTFSENFPTAFKTRVNAQVNASYAGQGIPGTGSQPPQNVPGAIYNSDSTFELPIHAAHTADIAAVSPL